MLRLLVLAALLIAVTARAENEPPAIKVVRSWFLAASDLTWREATPATHGLRLTLIVLRDTAWNPETILATAKNMAPLLAQCGVRIVAVELRQLAAPPRFRYYQTPASRELARLAPVPRPAIYFVEDTLNRPAFDAEAIGRANSGNRPELADTIWVAAGTRDLHVALAHELFHVLEDSGAHSDEPNNLMRSETTPENTRLTDSQCARMRATAQRNGLLMPLGTGTLEITYVRDNLQRRVDGAKRNPLGSSYGGFRREQLRLHPPYGFVNLSRSLVILNISRIARRPAFRRCGSPRRDSTRIPRSGSRRAPQPGYASPRCKK